MKASPERDPVVARIDVAALNHNLQRVRDCAPGSRVMAVVKANAYGHGLVPVARALGFADAFAVARVSEGMALREAGIDRSIVVLQGFGGPAELAQMQQHRLAHVIHNLQQVELLEQLQQVLTAPVWLKVDTGMHRLGFDVAQAREVSARLAACKAIAGPVGIMTHLACADDRRSPATDAQISLYDGLVTGSKVPQSIANSGAVLGWPDSHRNWVRPGIMLYGVSPFIGRHGGQDDLRPVMTLQSRIISVRQHHQGDAIGYGGSWTCPEDMPIGVIAIGYGDGYPRHAKPGTPVRIGDREVPLVGRVSMDAITVDLRRVPDARVGDVATLWGKDLPVETIADHADTIAYELLTSVTARVRFDYGQG